MNCEVQKLNVEADHVHLIVQIRSNLSVSAYMGRLKGQDGDSNLQRVPRLTAEAILGQPILGVGILRRDGGIE